ncbi:MAG: UPF0182 family protein, partial [Phormidesmis sp.]
MARASDRYAPVPADGLEAGRPGKRRGVASASRWIVLGGLLVLAVAYAVTYYLAEGLWFDELGFLSEFVVRSRTQIILGTFTLLVSLGFTFFNFNVAERLQFNRNCLLPNQANLGIGMGLRALLPVLLLIGIVICAGLFHYIQLAATELTTVRSPIPTTLGLSFTANWALGRQLLAQPVALGLVVGGAIALTTAPMFLLRLLAVVLSACFGIILTEEWARVLPALNPTSFEQLDPLFGQDLSFYIFRLPLFELVEFWVSGLLVFVLAAVTLEYLLAGNTFSQGRFAGFSSGQQRHLSALTAALLAVTAITHWLNRYELLYSQQGVSYGASFTDTYVSVPVNVALSIISLGLSLTLLWRALGKRSMSHRLGGGVLRARPIVGAIALYLLFALLGNTLAPWIVQR